MTPEQIEEWRKAFHRSTDFWHAEGPDALCDLAMDGLRFRKWVEGWNTSPIKLECLLDPCNSVDSYREAIDKFVVELRA